MESLLERRPADVQRLWVASPGDDALAEKALSAGVKVERAPKEKLAALSRSEHHQGLVAEAAEFRYAELSTLTVDASSLLLALDSVQDPHNLGALARSAECFGATGLLVPQDRAAQVTGAALKASAGALERLPIVRVVNLVRALDQLKQQGMWVTGLAGEGADLLPAVDLTGPTVLVVGAEGDGLRLLVRKACDRIARIPMQGRTGSLNASVAGAVALFEAQRQRLAQSAVSGRTETA